MVTIDDPVVGRMVSKLLLCRAPGERSLSCEGLTFRRLFEAACVRLGLASIGYKPYSLRRGGATHDMMAHGDLPRTIFRGRWSDMRTARIYINDGLAVLINLQLPGESAAALAVRAEAFAAAALS